MAKKARLRMHYSNPETFPSLDKLPICYQCGSLADIPLCTLDIEVDPDEIDVELLAKTIQSITNK